MITAIESRLNIVILGSPGTGKGTYASRLSPKLGIVHISTGDLARDEIRSKTKLGKEMEKYVLCGKLIPDKIMVSALREKISKLPSSKGFILDGFPRTIPQAKALSEIVKIDIVIILEVPKEILIEKLSARRVCKRCSEIYNLADIKLTIDGTDYNLPSMAPKRLGICDKCGGELYQRSDDDVSVIKERLKVYEDQTKPVIDYFKNRVPFLYIKANRGPEIIMAKILKDLKKMHLTN